MFHHIHRKCLPKCTIMQNAVPVHYITLHLSVTLDTTWSGCGSVRPAVEFIRLFLSGRVEVETQICVNSDSKVVVHDVDCGRVFVLLCGVCVVCNGQLRLVCFCFVRMKNDSPPATFQSTVDTPQAQVKAMHIYLYTYLLVYKYEFEGMYMFICKFAGHLHSWTFRQNGQTPTTKFFPPQ